MAVLYVVVLRSGSLVMTSLLEHSGACHPGQGRLGFRNIRSPWRLSGLAPRVTRYTGYYEPPHESSLPGGRFTIVNQNIAFNVLGSASDPDGHKQHRTTRVITHRGSESLLQRLFHRISQFLHASHRRCVLAGQGARTWGGDHRRCYAARPRSMFHEGRHNESRR